MIPADVDMPSLQAQLLDDRVAFGTANPANLTLEPALKETLYSHDPSTGVVVLETTPLQVADLRDIAQDLANSTGLDTVIVLTPQASAAVSSEMTRHQVETAQRAMMPEPDYPASLTAFFDTAQATSVNWPLIALGCLALLALATAAAVAQTRRAGSSSH